MPSAPKKQEPCQSVSHISVRQWTQGQQRPADDKDRPEDGPDAPSDERETPNGWRTYKLNSADVHADAEILNQRCAESRISILSVDTRPEPEPRLTSASTASANRSGSCRRCQDALTKAFGMPPEWWSQYYRNANGYFGCAEQDVAGAPTVDTWARFQTKQERGHLTFEWEKIHLYTRWVPSLSRTIVVLFDMAPPVVERLTRALMDADMAQHVDPLWVYVRVAGELASHADDSVWAIRNHVRAIEKDKGPGGPQQPDFRRLHDLARHTIHVAETLDVSTQTLEAILAQHKEMRAEAAEARVWKGVHQRLLAPKQVLDNLRCRAQANQARLQNEIQLAFNGVALQDSRASVQIGRAAQVDSAAMKTISLLTLIFLPPTFTCAIFSMSFFNYDAGGGGEWSVSPKFWLYWAFAVPLTAASAAVCYYWQAAFPPAPPSRAPPAFGRPGETFPTYSLQA